MNNLESETLVWKSGLLGWNLDELGYFTFSCSCFMSMSRYGFAVIQEPFLDIPSKFINPHSVTH